MSFTVIAIWFNFRLSTHHDPATTGFKGMLDAFVPVDGAAGREIRGLDVLHERVNGNVPVINVGNGGIYHFGEVVRRHVGSHSHGNAGSAVHKQGGYSGWKYGGFFQ